MSSVWEPRVLFAIVCEEPLQVDATTPNRLRSVVDREREREVTDGFDDVFPAQRVV